MKLAAVAAALFSMGALATPTTPVFNTYHFTDLEWQVEVSPGQTIAVNGTIEAVAAQLHKSDPNWKPENHNNQGPAGTGTNPAVTTTTAATVKRATDFGGGAYFCGARWPYAPLAAYWEGMRYLRSLKGQVHMPPGPGLCSRVSCSHDSAVYICNDRTEDLYLDSFERIADGVSYIIGWCATAAWGPTQVAGQLFHPDNWNIIVRRDSC